MAPLQKFIIKIRDDLGYRCGNFYGVPFSHLIDMTLMWWREVNYKGAAQSIQGAWTGTELEED